MVNFEDVKKQAELLDIKSGITKKLDGVKFDQAFDKVALSKAEKAFSAKEEDFKNAVLEEYHKLKDFYDTSKETEKLGFDEIKFILESAFQIKSIAGNGGYPVATEIAKSLFEYCEKVSSAEKEKQVKTIRLHIAALEEILADKFDSKDEEKVHRLINGLKTLTELD